MILLQLLQGVPGNLQVLAILGDLLLAINSDYLHLQLSYGLAQPIHFAVLAAQLLVQLFDIELQLPHLLLFLGQHQPVPIGC